MPSRFLGIALASLVAIAAYAIFALQLTPQSVLDWNLRLPQVDLGYSVYQASAFDVCFTDLIFPAQNPQLIT